MNPEPKVAHPRIPEPEVFENGEPVFPCRCGEIHRGEWAETVWYNHNCFHNGRWVLISKNVEPGVDHICCLDCGMACLSTNPGTEIPPIEAENANRETYPCRCGWVHVGSAARQAWQQHECFHLGNWIRVAKETAPGLDTIQCSACGIQVEMDNIPLDEQQNGGVVLYAVAPPVTKPS